jgi:hypothetical protein
VVTVNQVKYQKEDKTYQIFLQQLFSDCNSKPDLHLCAFNKKALSQAVYEYNLCMGEKVVRNQYKKEKSIIVTGIRIGGNYFSMASSSYKFSPSVGVFVNLPLSKANRILAGQLEGNYNEYRADVGKDAIRYNVFDLTALIRFTYPKGLIRPFSGIGFTFGFGKEYAKYATSPKYKYLGKVDNPKLAFEAGLQVPLWRKYLYTSARYERFIFTPTGYYKPFNFSLGFGF